MFCGNCPECVQRAGSASIIGHLGEDESFFLTPHVCGNCPVGVPHTDSASIIGRLGGAFLFSNATSMAAITPCVCNTRTASIIGYLGEDESFFPTPHVVRQLSRRSATHGLCIDHRPSWCGLFVFVRHINGGNRACATRGLCIDHRPSW